MNNVVLIGFMGAGKTTVGRALAQQLERAFVDLDDVVVAAAGKPVTAVFADEGEEGFRRREAVSLDRVLGQARQVVAVGGGAPMAPHNWEQIRRQNCVVALTARPQTLQVRLDGQRDRPLLKDGVQKALTTLLPARASRYLEADLVFATDGLEPATVAARIARSLPAQGLLRVPVDVQGSQHEITIGRGLDHLAGPALTRAGVLGTLALVTDETVFRLHGARLVAALEEDGRPVKAWTLPAGEAAKSLEQVGGLYEFFARSGIDRRGGLIALGGGSVGDTAGFAAATWLRGIRYLQMPTTLLAMVDSGVGGKTAVNLPAGKNLVGAVHQPVAILSDLAHLDTLPEREFRSAWAEVIKSAIIGDASLFDRLGAARASLMARDPSIFPDVVARCCAFKAGVIAEDPFDRGRRAILNYGHTVGHALEAAAGYGRLLHGEAVAWGMLVAGRLSRRLGFCAQEVVDAQERLLREFGLLQALSPIDPRALRLAMVRDKKVQMGELRWVLLRAIGQAEPGCRVASADVDAVLQEVMPW